MCVCVCVCVRACESNAPLRCVVLSTVAALVAAWQTSNPGPSEGEQRANRNVETQTVSVEPFAVRPHPQEDGLGTGSKSGTSSTD